MKEHNNRDIAKKHAEYITGQELRRYMAEKVKKYVGDSPTVFDGAVGSGQLEQFVNPKWIYGVEIQEKACEVFKENYPNSTVNNISFFNYNDNPICDCVIMNPPFSIKLKDLSDEEQENIMSEFSWKKSGVVDDIFVLKSLIYTKRFGFYILFPGLTYRKTESKFRELVGDKLAELNWIKNAFVDTGIDVIFLVVDKEKTDVIVAKEIYDCKIKEIIHSELAETIEDRWTTIRKKEAEEKIDILELEKEIAITKQKRRNLEDELDKFIAEEVKPFLLGGY